MDAINGTGMPVNYSWTASNGNKFTNLIEVLEGQTIVEAGHDMNAIGSSLRGNYTWKNQWYEASNGSGNAIIYDSYIPKGNDITIYGKWVYQVTYQYMVAISTVSVKVQNSAKSNEVLKGKGLNIISNTLGASYGFGSEYYLDSFYNGVQGYWNYYTVVKGTRYKPGSYYTFSGNVTIYACDRTDWQV